MQNSVFDNSATEARRPTRRSRAAIGRGLAATLAAGALALGLVLGTGGRDILHIPGAAVPVQAQAPAVVAATSANDLENEQVATAQRVGPAVVSIRTDQGLGSGVIYDSSGLVLTNAHVVEGAHSIAVRLSDGRRLEGRVLGRDVGFDLAVVKVDANDLPAAPLGSSSELKVGQFVVAIGNPYGLDSTVTTGVVSALNRPISEGQQSYAQPMIQTNAAINPGNSGGPLVDLQGNIIGINTLVAAPQGYPAQGLGFAVPVDTAKRIAPQLAQNGKVTQSGQPYLGVAVGDAGPTAQASVRNGRTPAPVGNATQGALLQRVEPNGAAANAGLKDGDIITKFDGKSVYSGDDFLQNLVLKRPGDKVDVEVNRAGQTATYTVTLGEAAAR
ncbi:MAG TPA: trypsin-like peptidase domain-containing protein [Chloroflexota bacterium]|jgi:S1-C subfamily serine protease|nr:trypsin-like peptidase domain-containing protein [Chloroflexota bacterium]